MGNQTSLKSSQGGGGVGWGACNPLNPPPGSASVYASKIPNVSL